MYPLIFGFRYLLSALAAVKGQAWLARYIGAAEVEIDCPNCGEIISTM